MFLLVNLFEGVDRFVFGFNTLSSLMFQIIFAVIVGFGAPLILLVHIFGCLIGHPLEVMWRPALVLGSLFYGTPLYYSWYFQGKEQEEERQRRHAAQVAEVARRKAEQVAEVARRKAEYDRNQAFLRSQLATLSSRAISALGNIPNSIASANRALDKAEAEFSEGVFAPFWDAVETALGYLTQYDASVRMIAESTTLFIESSKTLESQPPTFIPESSTIPDTSAILERLKAIVRRAQKVPDFAKIYEMRRTNSLLVAGFANLGSAIDNMGLRIQDSIDGLAQTFDSAISSMSQQKAEYYQESLSAIETLREQLASDSEAQREHAGNVEGMLDNIQRRRRPLPEKFRDGQY
jgi:hypothetical protein